MNFIKTPMKGMPEQMPKEMQLREYVKNLIKETYGNYGFALIETPAIEHIENLTNKQGGENEQLIFKILKRGEKLVNAENDSDLCDCGLRYDLTVPLSRFYANNCEELPQPFKSLQIGNVWRADRPQKGRFRQFTQCDIDIIGDDSILAEIELISATSKMLEKIGVGDLAIHINDRKILKAMALSCNFDEEKLDNIFIILDKMDKIGLDGVKNGLIEFGLNQNDINTYCNYFEQPYTLEEFREKFENKIANFLPNETLNNLQNIISNVKNIIAKNSSIVFSPTLVRGMSYYTGTIFEIELKGYNLSVAGGGRYDEMIGKYTGNKTASCGFSIGFERIIEILKETNFQTPNTNDFTAFLIAKEVEQNKLSIILEKANNLRNVGKKILVCVRNKNAKYQKEKLQMLGYNNFVEIFNDTDLSEV